MTHYVNSSTRCAQALQILFKRAMDAHQMTFALGESLAHLHLLWHAGEPLTMPIAFYDAATARIQAVLERHGLLDDALFAQRVGWPDQRLAPAALVPEEERPYFSLLLIRQGWPEVLP
jgi:precorrin-2 methylase